jgi:hypothetical protein
MTKVNHENLSQESPPPGRVLYPGHSESHLIYPEPVQSSTYLHTLSAQSILCHPSTPMSPKWSLPLGFHCRHINTTYRPLLTYTGSATKMVHIWHGIFIVSRFLHWLRSLRCRHGTCAYVGGRVPLEDCAKETNRSIDSHVKFEPPTCNAANFGSAHSRGSKHGPGAKLCPDQTCLKATCPTPHFYIPQRLRFLISCVACSSGATRVGDRKLMRAFLLQIGGPRLCTSSLTSLPPSLPLPTLNSVSRAQGRGWRGKDEIQGWNKKIAANWKAKRKNNLTEWKMMGFGSREDGRTIKMFHRPTGEWMARRNLFHSWGNWQGDDVPRI